MRWFLMLVVVGVALVLLDPWPALQRYLNPLSEATYAESAAQFAPPIRTRSYTAPTDSYDVYDFKFLGHTRKFHTYVPAQAGADAPVVFLLHGSTRNGASMVDMWQGAADKHGLVLIAPDSRDPAGWHWIKDGPHFFKKLANQVQAQLGLTFKDGFLFGHSAGAVHAHRLMTVDELNLWAVAVHAGGPAPNTVAQAGTAIPYRSYIGDNDPLFPLPYIRAGVKELAQVGYPSDVVILKDHGHWFYDSGPQIAEDAARWFDAVERPAARE